MPLSEVKQKHVWLLSEMMAMPSGDYGASSNKSSRRTPTPEELDAQIEALKEANIEMVWVTRNTLLVFLIPALLPWYLLGGPMAWFMPLIVSEIITFRSTFFGRSPYAAFPARCCSKHSSHCNACISYDVACETLLRESRHTAG